MQYKVSEYNRELHDMLSALSVKQPYADQIVHGEKTIEVRSKTTSHRGDLLICSSKKPNIAGLDCGYCLGLVELYDVKPVEEFAAEDWKNTCIPDDARGNYSHGFGWLLRNHRRVVEWQVVGQLGVWSLVFTKDRILEYPNAMVIDKKGYKQIMREIREGKI